MDLSNTQSEYQSLSSLQIPNDAREGKVCCFTGHRVLSEPREEVLKKLEKTITELIEEGYRTFLCGGAIGFDTLAAETVLKLKEQNSQIQMIMCIPCLNQDLKFNAAQKQSYALHKSRADRIFCISKDYSREAMLDRNKFMVNSSDAVITYIRRNFGGTAYTVRYAKSRQLEIINL